MSDHTIAVVTGASRGLGEAMALKLLTQGASLVTLARHDNPTLEQCATQHDASLVQLQGDLSDPQSAQRLAADIANHIPANATRCILVNNAGTVQPVASVAELTDAAAITAALTLNVTSIMLICAAFLGATENLGVDRRILNISSGAGRSPMPGWAVYCASKAAVDHYTQVLAQERPNIRAASLAPGVIDTQMQAAIRASDKESFPNVERFIELHNSGQLAAPDVAAQKIIQHLLSDEFGTTVLDDIRNNT